jgi:hypothetical protein
MNSSVRSDRDSSIGCLLGADYTVARAAAERRLSGANARAGTWQVCYKHVMSGTPVLLPSAVGRYRISGLLANHSVGEVYKGFDPLIERPVVVRVFRLERADPVVGGAVKQTFYAEMQRAGALMHYGIATLFDAGELPGLLFMAGEYVDAMSLAELLSRPTELDVPARVSLIAQIVDALEYAREQGVAHLGLSPRQVLLGADHSVKVGGFGVAPVVAALSGAGATKPVVTRYVAPERRRGVPGDHRSDVYSLARVALDVLSDTVAEPSTITPASVPPLPSHLAGQGVSPDRWVAVFDRALADDPADRFDTPGEFEVELLLTLGASAGEARMSRDAAIAGDRAPLPRPVPAGTDFRGPRHDATALSPEPPRVPDRGTAAHDTRTADRVVPGELAPDQETGAATPVPHQPAGRSRA